MSDRKNILSCIQPTGEVHLGNYLGAIQNWVKLQEDYDCKYGVVDYHTMTMPYQAKKLRENTWKLIFELMACGVEADNLFIQSMIPEHQELCWIFSCVTSYGELQRMTQFKDKSQQLKAGSKSGYISAGLFMYPVLQAADILIYHADYVPVGKDQEQHLELSRNIAQRFNHQFGKEYFTHPEPLFTETPKVLSTADPSRKMSKSLGPKHYIALQADSQRVVKQIKSAVTDTGESSGTMSAGIQNLFTILKATGNSSDHAALLADYHAGNLQYSSLKEVVATSLDGFLAPIRERHAELMQDKKRVKDQIKQSSNEIRKVAQETMREVRELVGIQTVRPVR